MQVKILLCNCKGICPSFKDTDMDTLLFELENELEANYAVLHPMLCGQGGNQVLLDILKSASPDDVFIVGACDPEGQRKLFKRVLRQAQFDENRFIPVEIRHTDNAGVLERLRQAIQQLTPQPAS